MNLCYATEKNSSFTFPLRIKFHPVYQVLNSAACYVSVKLV